MSSQTNTLTEGPLAKQIFLVSLPLALSNLLVARFYGARHPKDVEKTVHSTESRYHVRSAHEIFKVRFP